jgi:hypothetical protein
MTRISISVENAIANCKFPTGTPSPCLSQVFILKGVKDSCLTKEGLGCHRGEEVELGVLEEHDGFAVFDFAGEDHLKGYVEV